MLAEDVLILQVLLFHLHHPQGRMPLNENAQNGMLLALLYCSLAGRFLAQGTDRLDNPWHNGRLHEEQYPTSPWLMIHFAS